MELQARIAGTSLWASPTVVSAAQASSEVGRSEDWIVRRTGVRERRRFDGLPEVQAAEAARPLLSLGPIDLVLNASATPRQLIPDTAVFVARELGLVGVPAYSIHATCLSFVVALRHAFALVQTGLHKRILVVSSEISSASLDVTQPESAALLGDGAGAVVVEAAQGDEGLIAWRMHTFPEGAELTQFQGAGVLHHPNDPTTEPSHNRFSMNGPRVYKLARQRVGELLDELWQASGLTVDAVDVVVPHQASGNALKSLPKYGLSADKTVNIVGQYGNCIAASIPMALAHAEATGRLRRGQVVLLLGTGAGLSVAGALLRW